MKCSRTNRTQVGWKKEGWTMNAHKGEEQVERKGERRVMWANMVLLPPVCRLEAEINRNRQKEAHTDGLWKSIQMRRACRQKPLEPNYLNSLLFHTSLLRFSSLLKPKQTTYISQTKSQTQNCCHKCNMVVDISNLTSEGVNRNRHVALASKFINLATVVGSHILTNVTKKS